MNHAIEMRRVDEQRYARAKSGAIPAGHNATSDDTDEDVVYVRGTD